MKILLLVLCTTAILLSCATRKKAGCDDSGEMHHKFRAYKIIKIDSLHPGFHIKLRYLNEIAYTTCMCDSLPDNVKEGSIVNIPIN